MRLATFRLDCFRDHILYGFAVTLGLIFVSSHREHAPSIIFMDEIDSIGSARMESGSGNGDSEVQRTMLELLNQLDGFEASNKIKVLNYIYIYILFFFVCVD